MTLSLKTKLAGAVAGFALLGFASGALAADITGAGASFPYPIYAKWGNMYKGAAGVGLNYQSIGSGGGIAQIKAKTVTFGASDMPLTVADLEKFGLAQFPTVVGGIVPVLNVKGIKANELVLNGEVLAAIFAGKVTNWSDPAIAALNSGVSLPNQAIAVVHRSDGSGTTFGFTSYLCAVSPDWLENIGASTAVDWPVGIGAKGNEGVAGNVAQTSGSIGYVEYAYAKDNGLAYAAMVNHDGQTVQPSADSFQAAASGADWTNLPGFRAILVNEPGASAWPITSATFILMHKKPVDAGASSEALKFFKWAYENGDDAALSLDYVPLPDNAVQAIEASWSQIEGTSVN